MRAKCTAILKLHYHLLFIIILFLAIAACSGDTPAQSEQNSQSGTSGGISFTVKWDGRGNAAPLINKPQSPSGDVCDDYGIERIIVTIYNSNNQSVATESFTCSDGGGTLRNVPIGDNMRLLVQGLIGEDVLWEGERAGFSVTPGRTTIIGEVVVQYIGIDKAPPTITGQTPAPDETGVALDSSITITFSEPIVAASANSTSITIYQGSTHIAGSMTYDSDTRTVTFNPTLNLDYSAVYTVTVSTDIEDVAANKLEGPISWQFTCHHLSFTASAGPGGTISPSGQVLVHYGSDPTFTIAPDDGYYLSQLLIDGTPATLTHEYTFSSATTGHTISASFKPVWYVDGSASASGNGTTWQGAFNTIQAAVDEAADGDEIWIKEGDYILASQITIGNNVALYGGFIGTEIFKSQRNWDARETRLDGNQQSRCLYINADATIDGITISNGRVVGDDLIAGGGVYIYEASPAFYNCRFEDNQVFTGVTGADGGAVCNTSGTPVFSNCHFENNHTNGEDGNGGAIVNLTGTLLIDGCRFYNNSAGGPAFSNGGAICDWSGTSTIINSEFVQNQTSAGPGRGGALYLGRATVTGCLFYENVVRGGFGTGGAIYARGETSIRFCTLVNNSIFVLQGTTEGSGGGIYFPSSNSTVTNSILWGNSASEGSQIYSGTHTPEVTYCNIDQSGYSSAEGNIREDPMFGSGYHLQANSPCIDVGFAANDDDIDFDGELRPQGLGMDMGADEFFDTDEDAMPDYWENQHGLNPTLNDASDDPDLDQLTNLFEYQHNLDPNFPDTVVPAEERGFWDSDGIHDPSDNSAKTRGKPYSFSPVGFRSYFIFNLSTITENISSAVLRFQLIQYDGDLPSQEIGIFQVGTDLATLESGNHNAAVYNDLRSGNLYGQKTLYPTDADTIIGIKLDEQAIAAINAARGGAIAMGVSNYREDSTTLIFGTDEGSFVHELVLIPE